MVLLPKKLPNNSMELSLALSRFSNNLKGVNLVRIILAIYLFIHGFSHIVGFIVPWRIAKLEEVPYKTTILGDLVNVSDIGIRIIGIFWLLTALAFLYVGIGIITQVSNWKLLTILVTVFSLVLCFVGWPDSRIGVFANLLILIFLFLNSRLGWLS